MNVKTFGPVDQRSYDQVHDANHRRRPLGVAMAGGDVVDPYKD